MTTWNPADLALTTLSGGNLTATSTGTTGYVRATINKLASRGKFYWEVVPTSTSANFSVGFCPVGLGSPSGATASGLCGLYQSGAIWLNGSNTGLSLGTVITLVRIALDLNAKLVWFQKQIGSWNGSGTADPATGVGGISVASILSNDACPLVTFGASSEAAVANFGASSFAGVIPSGFLAWDVTNALATQAAAEHWLTTSPDGQITQVALEHWATVTGVGVQADVTQIALEHWVSIAAPPVTARQNAVTVISG